MKATSLIYNQYNYDKPFKIIFLHLVMPQSKARVFKLLDGNCVNVFKKQCM